MVRSPNEAGRAIQGMIHATTSGVVAAMATGCRGWYLRHGGGGAAGGDRLFAPTPDGPTPSGLARLVPQPEQIGRPLRTPESRSGAAVQPLPPAESWLPRSSGRRRLVLSVGPTRGPASPTWLVSVVGVAENGPARAPPPCPPLGRAARAGQDERPGMFEP